MTRLLVSRIFVFTLLGACIALTGSASAQVKVGAVSCLTGELSTFGVSSIQGARLAADALNGEGGVLGQKLELLVEDNGSKAGEAATIARKLLTQDHVAAILGDLTSSATMEAAPLAQAAGVPLLTPTATGEEITRIGEYIFRSCFLNSFSGQVMARFALDRLRATRAVVLTDVKQDYSVGLTAVIKAYFEAHGGRDLMELSFSSGDTDFRAQLTRARAFRPEVIFVPAYYPEAGLILRQARQLEIKGRFVGGEGWDSPALLQVAGKSADGAYYVNHFSAANPEPNVQAFVQAYRRRYGTAPDAPAALWYDGARLIADAIRRAGAADPKRIRDALAATKDFPGVTGSISMDANRNASKPGVVLTIRDGQVRMVEDVNP
ncbi:MAG: ABC transporter substrate-binding protein [Verrucomicrobia bacterium]|nr:ABC transporter substrate-binding protein [Verrucomicrobiota bacterium]